MAAEASECAAEQGKFGLYRDKLYENQRQGAFTAGNLIKFAGQLGLDEQKFTACTSSRQYAPKVLADRAEGAKLNIKATPTTVINGEVTEGLAPIQAYKSIIDRELAK
jgi:protein-disulfide isomerase